jgi:hypothetical protein
MGTAPRISATMPKIRVKINNIMVAISKAAMGVLMLYEHNFEE